MLTDPETGVREMLMMSVNMDLCQLVFNLETEENETGDFVYPKLGVDDVAFTLDERTWNITT